MEEPTTYRLATMYQIRLSPKSDWITVHEHRFNYCLEHLTNFDAKLSEDGGINWKVVREASEEYDIPVL